MPSYTAPVDFEAWELSGADPVLVKAGVATPFSNDAFEGHVCCSCGTPRCRSV